MTLLGHVTARDGDDDPLIDSAAFLLSLGVPVTDELFTQFLQFLCLVARGSGHFEALPDHRGVYLLFKMGEVQSSGPSLVTQSDGYSFVSVRGRRTK